MFYVELLRIRNGLMWSSAGLAVALLVVIFGHAVCRCSGIDISNAPSVLSEIAYFAAIGAAIFASVFGGSLSYENDDHLPLTWTKPIGRTAQALGTMALDALAVVAVFAMIYAAGWVFSTVLGGHLVPLTFDAASSLALGRALAFPLAWFGLTQALSAGYRGGRCGAIIGPMWPVLEGLFALTLLPLAAPWRSILAFINLPNPINYFPFWEFDERFTRRYAFGYGVTLDILALVLIASLGAAVAAARWRRVEA